MMPLSRIFVLWLAMFPLRASAARKLYVPIFAHPTNQFGSPAGQESLRITCNLNNGSSLRQNVRVTAWTLGTSLANQVNPQTGQLPAVGHPAISNPPFPQNPPNPTNFALDPGESYTLQWSTTLTGPWDMDGTRLPKAMTVEITEDKGFLVGTCIWFYIGPTGSGPAYFTHSSDINGGRPF